MLTTGGGSSGRDRLRWRGDARTLAELADWWRASEQRVPVPVPRAIAERAVEAWERSDEPDGALCGESDAEARVRRAAGSLALLGAAISDRGRWDGDEVSVPLALAALDDIVLDADAARRD